jgi:hypothetical protein
MISKSEFEDRFRVFLQKYELSLGQASVIPRISKLRAYLYRSGWFKFDQERETEIINRMANYILLQKLRSAWLPRIESAER